MGTDDADHDRAFRTRGLPHPEGGWSRAVQRLHPAVIDVEHGAVYAGAEHCPEAALIRGRGVYRGGRGTAPAPVTRIAGRHLWGGTLFFHFGHFLTESLSRLWGAEGSGATSILFAPKSLLGKRPEGLSGWQRQILDRMGVTLPVRILYDHAEVEELIVPGPGFGLGVMARGTDEFRAMARRMTPPVQPVAGRKLYLSRSALPKKTGSVLGEAALERRLEAEGFEIFHPQQHSIDAQLAAFRSASHLLGPDGSAFHLAGFVAAPQQRFTLIKRRSADDYRNICDQLSGMGCTVDVIDALAANWIRPGKHKADDMSWGEPDLPRLWAALADLGLVSGPSPEAPDHGPELALIAAHHKGPMTRVPLHNDPMPAAGPPPATAPSRPAITEGSEMEKIVWTSLEGHDAPEIARGCIERWRQLNPGWQVRVLSLRDADRYTCIFDHVDLGRQRVTPVDFAKILAACVLREHGGVWADAATFCTAPLDEWLPEGDGFFAFRDGGIAPWFLSGGTDDPVVKHLHAAVLGYWKERTEAEEGWFARLFDDLLAREDEVAARWEALPEVPGDSVLPMKKGAPQLEALTLDLPEDPAPAPSKPRPFAQIKVSTENLGDHVQIIAGNRIMQRAGLVDPVQIDRDHEIGTAPQIPAGAERHEILMNGWYKNNKKEWPPADTLSPLYVGFHIRPKICPELVSDRAVAHYKLHEPIGCRDEFTRATLSKLGVDCWTSHCPTLTLPRRVFDPERQTKIYAVSRDGQLGQRLPKHLGEVTDIGHYSGSKNNAQNMVAAAELLKMYADTAGLIVTSLLHCAMPAIAMGIPVVMFFPPNDAKGRESDKQRFSSLMDLIPIRDEAEMDDVDWAGTVPQVTRYRLGILDAVYAKHDALGPLSRTLPGTLTA